MPKKTQHNIFTPALKRVERDLFSYLESSCYLVVSHDGYWGRGDSVEDGTRSCLKQGASRKGTASVLLILGDETAEINEAGYIIRDAGSHSITVLARIKLGSLLRKP
jgi:hypothetical protein